MHPPYFLFYSLLNLTHMIRPSRKEVVVLEPNPTRFKWITAALAEWANSPKLIHFEDDQRLLQYLMQERSERQSFFLIDARHAQRNAGLLLQQLRDHTPHKFTPIFLFHR